MTSAAEKQEQQGREARTRRNTYSRYLPGSELNIAAIVDEGGDESLQSVLFMYGQSLLTEGPTRGYPLWYQLGVANLLNGALVRPDGTVLLNGKQTFAAEVQDNQRAGQRLDLPALLAGRRTLHFDCLRTAHRPKCCRPVSWRERSSMLSSERSPRASASFRTSSE